MKVSVIILAAGQGTRMHSVLPKVLHTVGGRPMLEHVMTAAFKALDLQPCTATSTPYPINVVVGYGAEKVRQTLGHYYVNWVVQDEQLGTGHAVKQALPLCANADIVLVLYGDVPLIRPQTLQRLIEISAGEHLALLSVKLDDPTGYGRIIRNKNHDIIAIAEEKDASDTQKSITEINTGLMAIPGKYSYKWLNALMNNNVQKEYYLTDVVAMAVTDRVNIVCVHPENKAEVQGVNSRKQQATLERYFQHLQAENLMQNGVTLADPSRLDIRGNLVTGKDVSIDINCIFEGEVVLGDNVSIGAGSIIRNASIDNATTIEACSFINESKIGKNCHVGPFARLRPGTLLSDFAKIGNFVETKKTTMGERTKINHLSYVGDAKLGADVNVGAGTITCNYDGVNKHETIIKDHAFIGSNTALVAPVTIGEYASTGAGSTITENIKDEQLGLSRSRQQNITGWCRPTKKD